LPKELSDDVLDPPPITTILERLDQLVGQTNPTVDRFEKHGTTAGGWTMSGASPVGIRLAAITKSATGDAPVPTSRE
jgi:hypothetical protein